MEEFTERLEEIKTLLSSNSRAEKPLVYSSLLELQERFVSDPSLIRILAQYSKCLLSAILTDIFYDDEEIAARALKCLGFMIYHPSIVPAILVEDADLIVDSLARVITSTKIKSVCNFGVWCISIQQFKAPFLAVHFPSLLSATVHALDNPIGSLSITFEGIQAVLKLVNQLSEKMRDSSNIWAPPIYRRLVSVDKRERDMSERCLLNIRSTIIPPPLTLSKALLLDIKPILLPGMNELLNKGLKVQSVKAWEWFIRLLGPYAIKNRHVVNDMLKILEQTFSDYNPQVQLASQIAWEGLIDSLIHPPVSSETCSSVIKSDGFTKGLKLIMTPLIGIISSKGDMSVRYSCLNTWRYLLRKLGSLINSPSVIKQALEPIFEAVFQTGAESESMSLWNFCIEIFENFILAKTRGMGYDLNDHLTLRWFPWDLNMLGFHIKMIDILISEAAKSTVKTETRSLICDTSLRLFKFILKGIQVELANQSRKYDETMLILKTVLSFVKKIAEDLTSKAWDCTSLLFLEAVITDLQPSILGCPLYKVAVDLGYINLVQYVKEGRHRRLRGISSITYMDMVSPVVYLTLLHFSVVFQSALDVLKVEFIIERVDKYLSFLFSSYDTWETLHVVIDILYKHPGSSFLNIWVATSKGLKNHIDGSNDNLLLKLEKDSFGYLSLCYLLSYPLVALRRLKESTEISEISIISSQMNLELACVIEVWRSLYSSVKVTSQAECAMKNSFPEDLSVILNGFFDENFSIYSSDQDLDFLSLCGGIVEQILITSLQGNGNEDNSNYRRSGGFSNSLDFAARFMQLAWTIRGTSVSIYLVTSRVFSELTRFVGQLHLTQDILLFMEIISSPLLLWLSHEDIQDKSTIQQLQLLWIKTLNNLQSCWPPLIFDSSFLKLQAPLLEKTLDHPVPTISEPTITFWNSTFGENIKLDYPQSLHHILDKLAREGRVNLHKKKSLPLEKCQSRLVTSKQNRVSKRVEFVEGGMNCLEENARELLGLKRKRLELTEHQKEVRRAQQGRGMDCSGHGPGIRTYTSVDFSQGNEESQDSQELRNTESILELLRNTH